MKHSLLLCILLTSLLLIGNGDHHLYFIEICDNAIDDDGDGMIDLNDADCECEIKEPESLIPNPSFEDQICCPVSRSQLNCAEGWIQASEPTTDYIHNCGFQGWEGLPPPRPFPDGDGIVGFRDGRVIMSSGEPNWKEYAGACLTSPLLKGTSYTFEFYLGFINSTVSPPIDITFFGTTDCQYLPFGKENEFLGCPTNDSRGTWKFLNSKRQGGVGWVKMSLTVTPNEDIHAIAIGPPCRRNTSVVNLYYFFDNLVLAESKFFSKKIVESGNPCTNDFELSVEGNEDATYQWYKDGIALVGETSTAYKPNMINGDYSVMEYRDGSCNLSSTNSYRVPIGVNVVNEVICEDETFAFGDKILRESGFYRDTFVASDYCDSIVSLNLSILGNSYDTVEAKIFDGDRYLVQQFSFENPGEYEVSLLSKEGCDSLVLLDLSLYDIYIPNAFSPNDDGINDFFEIFDEEDGVEIASIQIFNRWGNRVYHFDATAMEGRVMWDGTSMGNQRQSGVYTYVIEFLLENRNVVIRSGEVAMML